MTVGASTTAQLITAQVLDPSTPAQTISYGEWPADVEATRHAEFISDAGGYITVRGMLRVPADPALIWRVLTAYEACAEVFSSIQSSEVETKEDGRVEVLQKCTWSFLAFSGSFDTRLAVMEDAAAGSVVFKLIQSSFMRDFEGRWHIKLLPSGSNSDAEDGLSVAAGAEQAEECVVEHTLSVKPTVPVPPPFSFYTRSIFVQQVDGVLQDLQREILRQQALQQMGSQP